MTVQIIGNPTIVKDQDGHYRKFKNDKIVCALCYEGEGKIKLAKFVAEFNHDEELDVCEFHADNDGITELWQY